MVVSKSTSSTLNRTAYSNLEKSKLALKKHGRKSLEDSKKETAPHKRVKVTDKIEISNKMWMHTENWIG